MWFRVRVAAFTLLTTLLVAAGATHSVAQSLTLLEPDYTASELPSRIGAAGLACSPGGAWGEYVYIVDSAAGMIERIDFDDNVTTFAGPFSFPVGLAFGPGPANDFGDLLYVGDFGKSALSTVNSGGSITPFNSFPGPGDLTFDRSGTYGTELFCASTLAGSIYEVSSAGSSALFSGAASAYLSFGPGGGWGGGLYSTDRHGSVSGTDCCFDNGTPGCSDATCQSLVCGTNPFCCLGPWNQTCANLALGEAGCACLGYGPGIVQVDSGGSVTSLVDGFATPQGFDWAEGPGWNGDMFATDLTYGLVRRVQPGGTRSDFAQLVGAADVAFCNCALYLVSLDGEFWRITSDADDSDNDGSGDACDTCPGFYNPGDQPAVFEMDILASSKTEFSWPTAADVRYLRGKLSLVSVYGVDFVLTVTNSTSFSDPTVPLGTGAGFYYLTQPDCPISSWQTRLGAEPGRDAALP
jgi:hypothetical protein